MKIKCIKEMGLCGNMNPQRLCEATGVAHGFSSKQTILMYSRVRALSNRSGPVAIKVSDPELPVVFTDLKCLSSHDPRAPGGCKDSQAAGGERVNTQQLQKVTNKGKLCSNNSKVFGHGLTLE